MLAMHRLGSSAFLAAVALTIMVPLSAQALPFNSNPASFRSWLNQIPSRDGDKWNYIRLDSCNFGIIERGAALGNAREEFAQCQGGYAEITSPQGVKVCQLGIVGVRRNLELPNARAELIWQPSLKECRWNR
jgi:hypothetical protein